MKTITVKSLKKYVCTLTEDVEEISMISSCLKKSQIKKYINNQKRFYDVSLALLMNTTNYTQLEYHLSLMNLLYDHEEYMKVKETLFNKLIGKQVNLSIFKVLLQTQQLPEYVLIENLYTMGRCDALDCARFSLYIDAPYNALQYLKMLDYCDDDVVLRLLSGYSKTYYLELMTYYKLKSIRKVQFV